MKRTLQALTMMICILGSTKAPAQTGNDIRVFGYFQALFNNTTPKEGKQTNTFSLQQLNLFFNKDLSSQFNAFVNFELSNSYSSQRSWGYFNLDEAWVRYSPAAEFNVQAGMLIPTFNNLNTMKNKTPLLPYVFRPLVYESSISSLLDFPAYLPERAFVQMYGTFQAQEINVDYSLHVGNSEQSYIAQSVSGIFVPGNDTTTFKSFGGRVGVRGFGVRFGVSGTLDRDNKTSLGMGNLPRTRFGVDASVVVGSLTVEGEYIHVNDKVNDEQKSTLDFISTMNPIVLSNLEKSFYYGNVSYEVTDALYAYAGYSLLDDKNYAILADGLYAYTAGAGYRPVDNVVVKAQWAYFKLKNEVFYHVDQSSIYMAVSVLF